MKIKWNKMKTETNGLKRDYKKIKITIAELNTSYGFKKMTVTVDN